MAGVEVSTVLILILVQPWAMAAVVLASVVTVAVLRAKGYR